MTPLMKMIFDPFHPQAHQACAMVKQIIAQAIQDDSLPRGMALPSTAKLANYLEISKSTVARAYQELKNEGLLDSIAGKVTKVALGLTINTLKLLHTDGSAPVYYHGRPVNLDQLSPLDVDVKNLNREIHKNYFSSYNVHDAEKKEELVHFVREKVRIRINPSICANYTAEQLLIANGYRTVLLNLCYTFLQGREVLAMAQSSLLEVVNAVKGCGREVCTLREDEFGMVMTDLEQLCQQRRVGIVYLNSRASHVSRNELSEERIAHLVQLSNTYKFMVIEDDHYQNFDAQVPNPLLKAVYKTKLKLIYLAPLTAIHSWLNEVTLICGAANDIAKLTAVADVLSFPMVHAVYQVMDSGKLFATEKMINVVLKRKVMLSLEILTSSGLYHITSDFNGYGWFFYLEPAQGKLPDHFYAELEKRKIFVINPAKIISGTEANRGFIISIAGYLSDQNLAGDLEAVNEKVRQLIHC